MAMINQIRELEELCKSIDAAGRFAMDMEFIPERTYKPELCLVQVAVEGQAYLIDPLALGDLTSLWRRVANPNIAVILHAAEQDLLLVHNISGLLPQNVFDTQIAAGFAGFGYPLGYGKLVSQLLGVNLDKTESYTDWLNRPLTESQISYALDDAQYLLPVYDHLCEKLRKTDRLSWVQQECLKYSEPAFFACDQLNKFLRIKGSSGLSRRGLAVLQLIFEWRDQEASKQNRPLRTVLPDNLLLELSRRPPADIQGIQRIRGFRMDQIRNFGEVLLKAIKKGLSIPDNQCPVWPLGRAPGRREVLCGDLLFVVLKVICNDFELAPELVATRSDLQDLIREYFKGNTHPALSLLSGWRYDLAGKTMLKILGGAKLEMKLTDGNMPIEVEIH